MIKKLIAITLFTANATAATFVHPMNFDNSKTQRQQVVDYIKSVVNHEYCKKMDMCTPSTLRMMERSNLKAFKQLTTAKNRKLMDRIIRDYCRNSLRVCSYTTIKMMYAHNLSASKQQLKW